MIRIRTLSALSKHGVTFAKFTFVLPMGGMYPRRCGGTRVF
ncbi:hypothetical protein J2Z17_002689 [Rhizobium halophytocola]|uniref:Uncharacterized protein n=1 Tax=Rhizobium halophytocola TaxID=735519 RepID=A0ABS4DZX0_9HYPH|nr:hypothetical protein [Rhizobium halophytocola]